MGILNQIAGSGSSEAQPGSAAAARSPSGRAAAQRIGTPESVRAITSRWISLVPSKMV